LVPRGLDTPETPSTTRSYYTARSICSSRSQQYSGRSGEQYKRDKGQRSPIHTPSKLPQAPPGRPAQETREEVDGHEFTFHTMDAGSFPQRVSSAEDAT
jgi:hypothetical protein